MNVQNLNSEETKVFFINVYNCLFFHILAEKGEPKDLAEEHKMYGKYSYMIGKVTFTLNQIQKILKGSSPSDMETNIKFDFRVPLLLSSFEENLASSPFYVLSVDNLEDALNVGARTFLTNLVMIEEESKTVSLPSSMKELVPLFGDSEASLLEIISKYSFSVQEFLSKNGTDYKVEYQRSSKVKKSSLNLDQINTNLMDSPRNEPSDTMISPTKITSLASPVFKNATASFKKSPKLPKANEAPNIKTIVSPRFLSPRSNSSKNFPAAESPPSSDIPFLVESSKSRKGSTSGTITLSIEEESSKKKYSMVTYKEAKVWSVKTTLAEELSEENLYLPFDMVIRRVSPPGELFDELELCNPKNQISSDCSLSFSLKNDLVKKLSKQPASAAFSFAIGRGLKFAVSGEDATFNVFFVDSSANRCVFPSQKNVNIQLRLSSPKFPSEGKESAEGNPSSAAANIIPETTWEKESVKCRFRLHTGDFPKRFYKITININGESSRIYQGILLNLSTTELVLKAVWDTNCVNEVLPKIEEMQTEQIIRLIEPLALCRLIRSVCKKDNKSFKSRLISLFTRLFEEGKQKKFL